MAYTDHILHWIANFLTQRKMSVVVEGESSHEVDVESGVPQGTVFGSIIVSLTYKRTTCQNAFTHK